MPFKLSRGDSRSAMSRLTKFLVIKSVIDVLFVGALAASYDLRVFNPFFRGWLDEANPEWVNGWVLDQSEPGARVEVQLYVDGEFVDSRQADQPRPDLVRAGITRDERHGFFFFTPPLAPGEHEARVFAVHRGGEGNRRALHLVGKPMRFKTEDLPAEPYFRGWLDEASAVSVRGWVVNREATGEPVEVELYVDGRFVERRTTDQPRRDLAAAGLPGEARHGFYFFTPTLAPGEHEARVFAVRGGRGDEPGAARSLRLVGRPHRFNVPDNGVIVTPKGTPSEDDTLP